MMAGKFDDLEEMIKPFLKMMGDNIVTERPRLGGNFAYAVQTAEAFAEVTPKIAHQTKWIFPRGI